MIAFHTRVRDDVTTALLSGVILAFGIAAAAGADEPITIRSIAPTKSFALVAADDVRGTMERFRKTPLHDLWVSETVQSAVAEDWKTFQDGLSKRLQELGLPEDTLSWPVSFGGALFLERNEELDTLEPAFILLTDWGDGADKMSAFFEATFAETLKETPDRITTKDIRGRRATIVAIPSSVGEQMNPMSELGSMEKLVYVRDGTRFLMTSGEYAMEDALTAIDVPPTKIMTEEEDARGALEQLGSGDVIGILRTGPLQGLVQEMGAGPMAMMIPMMGQLFGDIQAYGFSATVDGSVGMLDSAITIFTPGERKGLLTLFTGTPVAPAPALVPSDAIGYGHINVAFADLMKIIEGAVASLPEMAAQEIEPTLQMYGPVLTKALASLGPEVHVFTTIEQPITEESQRNTVAITCSDEQAVMPLINMFAPMIGLQSRDFVGQTIFSGEGIPMAVGFGGGFLIVGSVSNVEQSLRATGQGTPTAGTRSDVEKSAMALLPSQPMVSWGWFDTVAGLEVARQLALAGNSNQGEMMDFVDEQGKAVTEAFGVEIPTKMIESLRRMDAEFLSQYIGPQLWQFTENPRGFAYKFSLLRPRRDSDAP